MRWSSFPFGLRCALAFDHELTLALTRIAVAEIERRYRRLAREAGLSQPRGGGFVAIQRCGPDLRPNVHLHMQALDGAYGTNVHGREVFFQAPAHHPPPTAPAHHPPPTSYGGLPCANACAIDALRTRVETDRSPTGWNRAPPDHCAWRPPPVRRQSAATPLASIRNP